MKLQAGLQKPLRRFAWSDHSINEGPRCPERDGLRSLEDETGRRI
ncbi:MAG: hypothetical protein ABGZ23_15560 [Fuerstiella sp.]